MPRQQGRCGSWHKSEAMDGSTQGIKPLLVTEHFGREGTQAARLGKLGCVERHLKAAMQILCPDTVGRIQYIAAGQNKGDFLLADGKLCGNGRVAGENDFQIFCLCILHPVSPSIRNRNPGRCRDNSFSAKARRTKLPKA